MGLLVELKEPRISTRRTEPGRVIFLNTLAIFFKPFTGEKVLFLSQHVGDLGLILRPSQPGLGRSPGGGHSNPLQYSCLDSPQGQRSLVGYRPRGCKESDMTKRLSTAQHIHSLLHWVSAYLFVSFRIL